MWAALFGLLVEVVKLLVARVKERKRLSETEREYAENAHQRAVDTAIKDLIEVRDEVKRKRKEAKQYYENLARSSSTVDSDK